MISISDLMRVLILVILITTYSFQSQAQENIVTARPTLSLGSWVLPEHSVQWEQGAGYVDGADTWLYDAFFRASVSKSTELRILIPTLESKAAVLGVKWMAMKPEGKKPGVAFALDFSSLGAEDDFTVVGYRILVDQSLSNRLAATINAGKVGDGFFGDLTLALGIADRFGLIGEFWMHESWQQAQSGITYLINSETQLDLYGGLLFNSMNESSGIETKYTFGFGFSRRLKMKYTRVDE